MARRGFTFRRSVKPGNCAWLIERGVEPRLDKLCGAPTNYRRKRNAAGELVPIYDRFCPLHTDEELEKQ